MFNKVLNISRQQKTLVYECNKYKLEFLKVSSINQKLYENYYNNRKLDSLRVAEIMNKLLTEMENRISGEICVWKKSSSEIYYIYDGLHRLTSAFKLYNEHNKDMYVTMKTYFTDDEKDIIEDFRTINKAISIPLLYIEENSKLKRQVCENVTDWLCKSYPKFRSSSRNCMKPNFNRDVFIEALGSIENLDSFLHLSDIENKIINVLQKLNFRVRDYMNEKGLKIIKKSQFENFYLFYYDIDKIKRYIVKNLQ